MAGNDWTTMYWYMGVSPDYLGKASEGENQIYSKPKKPRKAPELTNDQHTLDSLMQ